MQHLFQVLKGINRYFLLAEKVLLCTLLFTMIFLSFGQIIGRKFSISYLWISPFLKVEVLWIVFLGAALATEYGQHIKIDFLANFVQSDLKKKTISVVAHVFAMLACLVLFLISTKYMHVMSADNSSSILRGIPDGYILFIIPYSFFMMFIRSILNIRKKLLLVQKSKPDPPDGDAAR